MTITNQNLDLDLSGESVTVHVTYDASFTPFERHLASQGLRYREEITVLENDIGEIILPPGGFPPIPDTLATFPNQLIPVTNGNSVQIISRNRSINIPISSLNEDPIALNPDEIMCRIRIRPIGFPIVTTRFTDTETLNIE